MTRLLVAWFALATCAAPVSDAQLPAAKSIGPFGGNCDSVVAHPTQPNELLLVKSPDGLVRSTDGGLSFQAYGAGLFNAPSDLVPSPLSSTTLFASSGLQILRSPDFGANWTPWTSAAPTPLFGVAPAPDEQFVLAWGVPSIYRFTSGGSQWTTVHTTSGLVANVSIAPSDPTRCYAATQEGVAVSTDAGLTFTVPASGLQDDTQWVLADPADALRVYAAPQNGQSGVWLSTDGGLHFAKLPSSPAGIFTVRFMAWEGSSSTGNLWVGSLGGPWFSPDHGATWEHAPVASPADPRAIAFTAAGDPLLACVGGLFRTYGGSLPWIQIGFPVVSLYTVAVTRPLGARIAGANAGVYSGDLGESLQQSGYFGGFDKETDTLLADPLDPGRWLAGGVAAFLDDGFVRVLTDNGAVAVTTFYAGEGTGTVWQLARHPLVPQRLLGALHDNIIHAGVIRSADGGASWQQVLATYGWHCRSIAFDPHVPDRAIVLRADNTWAESLDAGATWSLKPAWPGIGIAVTFAFDPWRPGTYYRADLGFGWMRSDNHGQTWNSLGPDAHMRSRIALSREAPGLLWLSDNSTHVLRSADFGASFETIFSTPNGSLASDLALDTGDGTLVIATLGASVWEQPQASPYVWLGVGTAGSGDFVPRHFASGGLPQPGNTSFAFAADRLLGGSTAWLYVGGSDLALPLFGGVLHTGPPQLLFQAQATGGTSGQGGSGAISIGVPIPPVSALVGANLWSQVFTLDTSSPALIALSQGLRTTIQP